MSKVLSPEQFEAASRAEVSTLEAAIANLHQEIASLEARLNTIAGQPTTAAIAEGERIESVLSSKHSLVQRIKAHFNPDRIYREYLNTHGKPVLEQFLREKEKLVNGLKPQIAALRKSAMEHEVAGREEAFDDNEAADTLALNAEHFRARLDHATASLRRNDPYATVINYLHQIQAA